MRDGIDRRAMVALSGGHLAVDFASGSVPALIPFLTDRFDLGYALAALLLLASTASSSLVQPLFGLWSDRRGALWLIPGGTILAALGVGLAAVAPAYPLALFLVLAGGLGVAAFHPEGAKYAAYASGKKRASGMSYFNIGGNTGYALGAFVTGLLVASVGFDGALLAMVPVAVVAVVLLRLAPLLANLTPQASDAIRARGEDDRRAMTLLGAVIAFRSIAWFTLLAFVPLYEVSLGHSKADGNRLLFLMLLAGAVGTLVLGPVADRVGLRRTLVVTQALVAPLVLVFVFVGGVPGAFALALVGPCVVGTFGVTMVLSQLYLPRHVGVASGLSVGLAMGIGGLAAVALGAVADAVDLKAALVISAVAPVVGVVFSLLLPRPRRRARRGRLMLAGLGHVDLVCRDLERSLAFYAAVFGPLGLQEPVLFDGERGEEIHYLRFPQPGSGSLGLRPALEEQRFELYAPGLHHLALAVEGQDEVDAAHAAAVAAGAEIVHAPRFWPQYHPDYYATFFLDPDGFRLEVASSRDARVG
jgi:MFS transporter, FSR family, fosmidomycin resistance protein